MEGIISVIYGNGDGKTTAAIGRGIRAVGMGKRVDMVQFLKGNSEEATLDVLKRLEPEMNVFRFEKYNGRYDELDEEKKEDELINIRNGINFVKKILSTDGCDVLILDEILGLVDKGILTGNELLDMLKNKPSEMDVILTGKTLSDDIRAVVSRTSCIVNE